MKAGKIIKSIVDSGKIYVITVFGNSMKPTYKEGDKVEITSAKELKVNDVILFEILGKLVLHRIVELNLPYIITKGDNHPYSDCYITEKVVIAKTVIETLPPLKVNEYKNHVNGITFVVWNKNELSKKTKFQLQSYGINLCYSKILPNKINLAINPGAEHGLEYIEGILDNVHAEDVAIHFNVNISNTPREGYVELKYFNGYFRIGKRIPNFMLECEESIYMLLGHLL